MLRRISIFLIFIITALATGIPQAIHEQEHEREHEQERKQLAQAPSQFPHQNPSSHHEHSEQDCPICAQFHAPMLFTSIANTLIDTGLSLPALPILPNCRHCQTSPTRISCRGPPSYAAC